MRTSIPMNRSTPSSSRVRLSRRQAGFSLLEIVLAVAILALITYYAIDWQRRIAEREARAAATDEMVTDLRILARAAREYVDASSPTWAEGSTHTISLATLTSGGYLPTSFGQQANGAGLSPFQSPYRIVSIRNTGEPGARTVVADSSADAQGAYTAAGVSYATKSAYVLKHQIAQRLVAEGIPAGSIPAASAMVTGGGTNAWTKNLSAWLGNSSWPNVAVLIGFPDLEPDDGTGTGPPIVGSPSDAYGECAIFDADEWCSAPNANAPNPLCPTMTAQACPASYPLLVAQLDHCGQSGTTSSSDIGTFTRGMRQVRIPSNVDSAFTGTYQCDPNNYPACNSPPLNQLQNVHHLLDVSLNNVIVFTSLCQIDFNRSMWGGSGWTSQSGTHHWTTGGAYNGRKDFVCCRPATP